MRACVSVTSEAEIVLVDLDHEFAVHISEHPTVHPVRHKSVGGSQKTPLKCLDYMCQKCVDMCGVNVTGTNVIFITVKGIALVN